MEASSGHLCNDVPTYTRQGFVENGVKRRIQFFLDILQQNGVSKLDGIFQHLQVIRHSELYNLQTLLGANRQETLMNID